MANALDAFRAQREAAEHLHARLVDVSTLLEKMRSQIDGLALIADLKATLREEQVWLAKARETIGEVRRWREQELRRFWFAILWRWALACVFALISSALAGAGYARATRPYTAEIERLQPRAELADMIERRLQDMTPEQRLAFERLMKLPRIPHR